MALLNHQYDAIRRMYDSRQLHNKFAFDLRQREVYACIPQIRELDNRLVSDSLRWLKQSWNSDAVPYTVLLDSNRSITEKKQALLTGAGFPADYLEMQYVCPDCKDTGYIDNEKCHCFRSAMIDLLYSQSNVKNAVLTENFDTFSFDYYADDVTDPTLGLTPLQNIKRIVATAKQFVEEFDDVYRNLLIYGNTGVGKTFLTNCIARELMDSTHSVIYLTSQELFSIMEEHKFNRKDNPSSEGLSERFDTILDCDLLIIDDLGTEFTNSFITSQLYLCINERHLNKRSTVISSNLSFEQLKNTYSERIFSRIAGDYILLKIIGEDIRLKKLL